MSRIYMLTPAATEEKIIECVVDAVKSAGGNPCPPLVVGVGIGGTFDKAALLAKKALMRPLDSENPDPYYADLEKELLEKINTALVALTEDGTIPAIIEKYIPTK